MKIREEDRLYYCDKHNELLEFDPETLEFTCPKDGEKVKGKEIQADENKTVVRLK